MLKVTTLLRHAQLCPAPCVPGHLPQLLLAYTTGEVLHDLLQLLDCFRLRFHHAYSFGPEREIEAGQVETVCGSVMGTSARCDPIVELRLKEVHDSCRYMARSTILLKPVLLPGGGVPHSPPRDRQKHLKVRLGVYPHHQGSSAGARKAHMAVSLQPS